MAESIGSSDPLKHPAVVRSRRKARWPFLVWLAAALLAGALVFRESGSRALSGVVEKQATKVGTLERAMIKEVLVSLGQAVKKGDLLVVLDASVLEASLAESEAVRFRSNQQARRQLESACFKAELDLNALGISSSRDEAEFKVLEREVTRLEALLERRLIDGQTLITMQSRKEGLKASVEKYPKAIAQLEEFIVWLNKEKATLLASFSADFGASALLRKNRYRLLAAHDGVVSDIFSAAGEVVDVGETVLTLVRERSNRVIALVPEYQALVVEVGQEYAVKSRLSSGRGGVSARVISRSPEIIALPQQRVLVPGRVVRGRQIILELLEGHDFLPGEAVQVRPRRRLFFSSGSGEEPRS